MANASATITVGNGGSFDYSSIQEAINHAQDGDKITVAAGTYDENLVVNKSVTLEGQISGPAVIDGQDLNSTVIVTADDVSITFFNIQNGGGAQIGGGGGVSVTITPQDSQAAGDGLLLLGNNCNIAGDYFTNDESNGIEVAGSNNVISQNMLTNESCGIYVSSTGNTISGNRVTESYSGINVEGAYNSVTGNILDNSAPGNTYLAGQGIMVFDSYNDVSNNKITDFNFGMEVFGSNQAIYNNSLDGNYEGIWLSSVSDCLISGNVIAHSVLPCLECDSSNGNTIAGNHIFGGQNDGVYLSNCVGNTIRNNDILNNRRDGLVLDASSYNIVSANNLDNNGIGKTGSSEHYDGIYLSGSSWNTISQNNITRSQYGGIVLNGESTSKLTTGSTYNTVVQNYLMDNFVGVEVSWCSNYNNLTANTISYNGQEGYSGFGVYICEYVSDTGVYNNYISHNFCGVYMFDKVSYNLIKENSICDNNNTGIIISNLPGGDTSTQNSIYGNNIANNEETGISLGVSSNQNFIFGNNIIDNGVYGLAISKSTQNLIYGNNFLNNYENSNGADAVSIDNSWNTTYTTGGGNYWSDMTSRVDRYSGPNQNMTGPGGSDSPDGICDVPECTLDYNGQYQWDYLPLMSPVNSIAADSNLTALSGNDLVVDQSSVTGVTVDIHTKDSSNLPSGSVEVGSTRFGQSQPGGVSTISFGGGAFYDVRITPIAGTTLGNDIIVTVTFTDPSITSSSVLSWWNDSTAKWVVAHPQIWFTPDNLRVDIPLSVLTGTVFMIDNGTALTVSCSTESANSQSGKLQTTITGSLTFLGNVTGVSGETIMLSYSDDSTTWQTIGPVQTGIDGSYTLTWQLPDSLGDGACFISASFAGDAGLTASSAIAETSGYGTGTAYTISASAGTGGSIVPSGDVGVNYGDTQNFTVTPSSGFHIVDVTVNGTSIGAVTSKSFEGVQDAYVILASFGPNPTPTPTASPSPAPTPTPTPTPSVSVSPGSATLDVGQSQLFSATPSGGSGSYTGYQWYVDGSAQSGKTASTFSYSPGSAGSYSITATVTDSLAATSTQSNAVTVTVNASPTVSITPTGPLSMDVGQVQMFTATPSGGKGTLSYQWYLDGSAVGTNSASYSYTAAGTSHSVTCRVTDSASTPVTSPASNAVTITVNPTSTPTPTPSPTPPTQTSSSTSQTNTTPTSQPAQSTASPSPKPTATPTSTPAVPEFTSITIALIALMAASAAILFCLKKTVKNNMG